jgi:hypothetical protein
MAREFACLAPLIGRREQKSNGNATWSVAT